MRSLKPLDRAPPVVCLIPRFDLRECAFHLSRRYKTNIN